MHRTKNSFWIHDKREAKMAAQLSRMEPGIGGKDSALADVSDDCREGKVNSLRSVGHVDELTRTEKDNNVAPEQFSTSRNPGNVE